MAVGLDFLLQVPEKRDDLWAVHLNFCDSRAREVIVQANLPKHWRVCSRRCRSRLLYVGTHFAACSRSRRFENPGQVNSYDDFLHWGGAGRGTVGSVGRENSAAADAGVCCVSSANQQPQTTHCARCRADPEHTCKFLSGLRTHAL